MKLLIQRVAWAEVEVDKRIVGRVERGLLIYVGVAGDDALGDATAAAEKVVHLRIFEDDQGKLNQSVLEIDGAVLAVPNFTLLADTRRGRRPAFTDAAPPETGRAIFDAFVRGISDSNCRVETGRFGAHMIVRSAAAGPANIVLDYPLREQGSRS